MKFKTEELNIANTELNITNAELEKIMHANEFLEVCIGKTLIRIYRNNTLKNEESLPLLIGDFIVLEKESDIVEPARVYKLITSGEINNHTPKKSTLKKEYKLIANDITIKATVEDCIMQNNIGFYRIRSIDKGEVFLLQINLDCVKSLTKKQIR